MKPLAIVAALIGGAIIGAGAIYWHDANVQSQLMAQLSELRSQAASESAQHEGQAKAAAVQIEELTHKLAAAEAADRVGEQERERWQAEIAKLHRALEATQRDHVAAQAALAQAQSRVAELSSAPTAATPVTPANLLQVADETAARSNMARRFGGLIQKLGLSQADADRFVGLMVSRQRAADDVLAATQTAGGENAATIGGVTDMVGSTLASVDADLHGLLGDAGYAQLKNYQATLGTGGTLTRLQTALADSVPLTDSQTQKLQQIITDSGVGHLTPQTIDKAQAAGFLSPEQLQAIQALYQQQRASQLRRRTGVVPATGP